MRNRPLTDLAISSFFGATNYLMGRCVRILLYHNISDNSNDQYAVDLGNFKAQMDYIADSGYKVISLKEALSMFERGSISRKSIVLTFDDGFSDFFTNAVPILNRYNFRATVFIVADHVGNISGWRAKNLNGNLMDWSQLREIRDMGHSIGSHGLRHCDLTKLSQEDLDKEVTLSKDMIKEKLGAETESFSYPWGICSLREMKAVRNAGYLCALTVGGRWHNNRLTNRFLLKRVLIQKDGSMANFARNIR